MQCIAKVETTQFNKFPSVLMVGFRGNDTAMHVVIISVKEARGLCMKLSI